VSAAAMLSTRDQLWSGKRCQQRAREEEIPHNTAMAINKLPPDFIFKGEGRGGVCAENYGEQTGLIDLENSAHNVVNPSLSSAAPRRGPKWTCFLTKQMIAARYVQEEKKIREFEL